MDDILHIIFDYVFIGDFKNLSVTNKYVRNNMIKYFAIPRYDCNRYSTDEIVANSIPLMKNNYKYDYIVQLLMEAIYADHTYFIEQLLNKMNKNLFPIGFNLDNISFLDNCTHKTLKISAHYNMLIFAILIQKKY